MGDTSLEKGTNHPLNDPDPARGIPKFTRILRSLLFEPEILPRKFTSKVLTNTFREGILALDIANNISYI